MSFIYKISSNNQIKMHLASICGFNQDDGFGNTISTFNQCKNDSEFSDFVCDFMEENKFDVI